MIVGLDGLPHVGSRHAEKLETARSEKSEQAEELLADRSSAPRHVCWHSQQAAERALKAALVLEGIDFSYTHDLNALGNLLPDSWPVRADLAELTGWVVQARYPGEWPEPSSADAVRAESEARAVHNAIAAEFRRRGLYMGVK